MIKKRFRLYFLHTQPDTVNAVQLHSTILCPPSPFVNILNSICATCFHLNVDGHDDNKITRLTHNRKQLSGETLRWLSIMSCNVSTQNIFHFHTTASLLPQFMSVRDSTVRCTDYTEQTGRHRQRSQHEHHSNSYIISVVCFCHTQTASPDWPGTHWVQLNVPTGTVSEVQEKAHFVMGWFPQDTAVCAVFKSLLLLGTRRWWAQLYICINKIVHLHI